MEKENQEGALTVYFLQTQLSSSHLLPTVPTFHCKRLFNFSLRSQLEKKKGTYACEMGVGDDGAQLECS